MPTRKEAEEYKKALEVNMVKIAKSDLPDYIKNRMLNKALEKWEAANNALQGLGIELED